MANNLKSFKFTNKADAAIAVAGPATGWEVLKGVVIDALAGNDKIEGGGGRTGFGIYNGGTINTGTGNDTITGSGSTGIYNDSGTINTGDGKDIVDALEGGFAGNGTTYLDAGNDTLKGFGAGNFYGGAGTDKLIFGEGTYAISASTVVFNGVTMNVNQFEKIGGANGGLFTFQDGTLTVSSTGVGTFA